MSSNIASLNGGTRWLAKAKPSHIASSFTSLLVCHLSHEALKSYSEKASKIKQDQSQNIAELKDPHVTSCLHAQIVLG